MLQSALLQHIGQYIDGQWVTIGEGVLDIRDPATGDVLCEMPDAGPFGAQQAVAAAHRAMQQPSASLEQRKIWLGQLAKVQADHREELARLITLENGKPLAEALGEVDYAVGFYREAARHLHVLEPQTLEQQPRDCTWTVTREPAGVAALITPWNFPLAMLAKKLSGAVAAGCATVTKPAEQTPLTCMALFHLIDQHLDLPAGFANMVAGDPAGIGDALLTHPAVRLVSFTGSTMVGRHLIEESAQGIKRLTLELGGNAPFVVFEDANLDHAADELMPNKFRCSGQTCVCTNRVYVHESVADTFAEKVVERVKQLKVGHGLDEGVKVGPLINLAGWKKVHEHVRDAIANGAQRAFGEPAQQPSHNWGAFYPPTVLTHLPSSARLSGEETFGPIIAIGRFADDEQAIQFANDTDYGLAAYFFTDDAQRQAHVSRALHFGHIGINTGTGPTPEAPFGGMWHSGFGREGAAEGILEFTEIKTRASK